MIAPKPVLVFRLDPVLRHERPSSSSLPAARRQRHPSLPPIPPSRWRRTLLGRAHLHSRKNFPRGLVFLIENQRPRFREPRGPGAAGASNPPGRLHRPGGKRGCRLLKDPDVGSFKVGRCNRHSNYLPDLPDHLSTDISSRSSPYIAVAVLIVQVIYRFLPLDLPDATERFDFNETNDSSSSDVMRALQYPSKENGPASETMEGATKVPSSPSADLNNLLASPGTEADPGA